MPKRPSNSIPLFPSKRQHSTTEMDDNSTHLNNLASMVDNATATLDKLIQSTTLEPAIKEALAILQTTMKIATTTLDKLKADDAAKSAEEIERRRSLVLIGLPEQNDESPQARAKMDEVLVEGVLDQLGVEARPVASYRLGRPRINPATNGGPRLIKVVLPASVFQHIALGNWGRRRDTIRKMPGFGRLIVRPSLTLEQRMAERQERAKRAADRLSRIGQQMDNNNQGN
jgi:hypothetical protein